MCFSDNSISVSFPGTLCTNYSPGFSWTSGYNIKPVIYPNPTSGIVHIENAEIVQLEVYGLTGTLVARFERVSIHSVDLSELTSGAYMLRLYNKNKFAFTERIDIIR